MGQARREPRFSTPDRCQLQGGSCRAVHAGRQQGLLGRDGLQQQIAVYPVPHPKRPRWLAVDGNQRGARFAARCNHPLQGHAAEQVDPCRLQGWLGCLRRIAGARTQRAGQGSRIWRSNRRTASPGHDDSGVQRRALLELQHPISSAARRQCCDGKRRQAGPPTASGTEGQSLLLHGGIIMDGVRCAARKRSQIFRF